MMATPTKAIIVNQTAWPLRERVVMGSRKPTKCVMMAIMTKEIIVTSIAKR